MAARVRDTGVRRESVVIRISPPLAPTHENKGRGVTHSWKSAYNTFHNLHPVNLDIHVHHPDALRRMSA
jgi:hypothetical protein